MSGTVWIEVGSLCHRVSISFDFMTGRLNDDAVDAAAVAALAGICTHALRYTAASLAIAGGTPVVSENSNA